MRKFSWGTTLTEEIVSLSSCPHPHAAALLTVRCATTAVPGLRCEDTSPAQPGSQECLRGHPGGDKRVAQRRARAPHADVLLPAEGSLTCGRVGQAAGRPFGEGKGHASGVKIVEASLTVLLSYPLAVAKL